MRSKELGNFAVTLKSEVVLSRNLKDTGICLVASSNWARDELLLHWRTSMTAGSSPTLKALPGYLYDGHAF